MTAHALIRLAGHEMVADVSGALHLPRERALIVADLHLEKSSSFARRGMLLPPYDTSLTLARLAGVIARLSPRVIVALGDSFHDRAAHERLRAHDRAALAAMMAGRDWVWVAGNHDPGAPAGLAVISGSGSTAAAIRRQAGQGV